MFSRSTEQAESIASPSAHAGPEGVAPPRRDPGQRRFDIGIVALTLGLAVVIVAGLVAYGDVHDANQAKARARAAATAKAATEAAQVDAVKQAYLAYWTALGQAYSQLSVAPLQPYTTPAGAQQEAQTMQPFIRSGYRYTLTADHDLQIVVYSGGQLASVDDIQVQHLLPLDPATMQPASPVKTLPIESSYALDSSRDAGWLIPL